MGHVDRLIPEHAVDREHLGGLEPSRLVRELVQHRGRDRRRVRPEDELRRLFPRERIPVAGRTVAAVLVHLLDSLVVLLRELLGKRRFCGSKFGSATTPRRGSSERAGFTLDVESVLHFSCRVLLRNVESVEAPERRFDKAVRRHLGEPAEALISMVEGCRKRRGSFAYPVSKKMLRNSSRTFISGCSAPPNVGAPSASKLYFLNDAFSHAPLTPSVKTSALASVERPKRNLSTYELSSSTVRSVSSLAIVVENSGPF